MVKENEVLNPNCPCIRKCSRHGDCTACRKHHSRPKDPPYCERKQKLGVQNK